MAEQAEIVLRKTTQRTFAQLLADYEAKYLYVFDSNGSLDYTRCRPFNPLDEDLLSFFTAQPQ